MPAINWLAIRTAYVVKGWTAQQCAHEFGVDRTTISKRASKEGWLAERHTNTTNATLAATTAAREAVAENAQAAALAHVEFVGWLGNIIKASERDLEEIKNPASRIKARRDISEMGERFLKVGRLVAGLKDGQASEEITKAEELGARIVREIVEAPKAEASAW